MAAAERAARDTAVMTNNYTEDGFVSTIDIWSFFMTIDKNVTWSLLEAFMNANKEKIIEAHPETNMQVLRMIASFVGTRISGTSLNRGRAF